LYAMTAGIAATKPIGRRDQRLGNARSHGRKLAAPLAPMARNEFMIPQTVPKRPRKGALTIPVVAREWNE